MLTRKRTLLSCCLCGPLLAFAGLSFSAAAQTSGSNEWEWVGGTQTPQMPVYGTLGTPAAGNFPGARDRAVGWTDSKGNLWLFGGNGVDSSGLDGYLNDLWEFNPSTNQWAWMGGGGSTAGVPGTLGTPAAGNIPEGRENAVGWTDANGNFWLFGGLNMSSGGFDYFNDLWEFNPSTNQWAWMGGSNTESCQQQNCGQPGVYGVLGKAAAGNMPGSRVNALSWTDSKGNLWLFGGYGLDSASSIGDLNDLWEFDPSANQWAWMGGSSTNLSGVSGVYGTLGTPAAGNIPGGRASASGWTDGKGNFWLFGGGGLDSAGNSGYLNDLWEFNPSTDQWAWMGGSSTILAGCTPSYGHGCGQPGVYGTLQTSAAGNVPGVRQGAASWSDSKGNLWLFGGDGLDSAGQEGYLNDLWEFNPSTNQWAWMGGSSTVACVDLFCFQPGVYGTLLTPGLGDTPSGRNYAINWTDGKGNLWLFGGTTYYSAAVFGFLQDLWEFQPNTGGQPVTATPTFSPDSGTYTTEQSVAISDATPGATIYYLIDGNTPASEYTAPILVFSSQTIEAIAGATGYENSNVATANYIANNITAAATPTFSPVSGTYLTTQSVTISDTTSGAAIYYTTDGTMPTTSSAVYGAPILVSSSQTILAIAVVSGSPNSSIASAVYTIGPTGTLGEWAWMGGSNQKNQPGVYGTLQAPSAGNMPGARNESTSWTDQNGNVWLLGGTGYDANGNQGFLNDLWEFNPSTNTWTWQGGSKTVPCTTFGGVEYCGGQSGVYGTLGTPAANNLPGGRRGAVSWTDSGGNFWLFGGYGIDSSGQVGELNDLWQFNTSTYAWTWVGGSSKEVLSFYSTLGQPGVYGALGVPAAGNIPGSRYGAASAVDSKGNFWLFGGTGQDANGYSVALNDLWEFNPTTKEWAWMSGSNVVSTLLGKVPAAYGNQGVPAVGITPGSLSGAAIWTDKSGNLFLFGGGDLWKYTSSASEWAWMGGAGKPNCTYDPILGGNVCAGRPAVYGTLGLPAAGNFPGGGDNAAIWTDSSGNIWHFGGNGGDVTGQTGGPINALWTFDRSTAEWTWMSGDYATSNCDLYNYIPIPVVVCDGSQGVFGNLSVPAPGNIPEARTRALSWTDKNGNFWLFSGEITDLSDNTGDLNDLWEYRPSMSTLPPSATPVFSLKPGTYFSGGPLTISNGMANASIYYTTDGTTPTTASNLYSGPIIISPPETVQSIATAPGYRNSSVANVTYSGIPSAPATPIISLASGTFTTLQTVTISDATPNATIYYTTDGTTPVPSSPVYSVPIIVSSSETITALAVNTVNGYTVLHGISCVAGKGNVVSAIASATYILNLPQATTPTFSLPTGTYTAVQTVTISDATPNATIYYAANATTPTPSWTLYTGSITVSSTETILAMAVRSGYTSSAVASATYTINLPAPSFTISGTTVTVTRGASSGNSSTITVTPTGGFTGSIALTPVVTSSPAGAQYLPTLSFGSTSPISITGITVGTATLTISTTAATNAALTYPKRPGVPWYAAGGSTLACLLLLGIPARRRSWRTMLGMLMLLVALTGGVLACGGAGAVGSGGGGGISGTTAGNYTITLTGASGSTTSNGTVTLTVR